MAHFNTVNARLGDIKLARQLLGQIEEKLQQHWPAAAAEVSRAALGVERAADIVRAAGYDK
jgi:hypothetical protein